MRSIGWFFVIVFLVFLGECWSSRFLCQELTDRVVVIKVCCKQLNRVVVSFWCFYLAIAINIVHEQTFGVLHSKLRLMPLDDGM